MTDLITTTDLRTDPRADKFWRDQSLWVDAMAELLSADCPPLQATLYCQLWGRGSSDNCTRRRLARIAKVKDLAISIRDKGYNPEQPITFDLIRCDDRIDFVCRDGLHRACILLALGRPVPAAVCGLLGDGQDPRDKYPLWAPEE